MAFAHRVVRTHLDALRIAFVKRLVERHVLGHIRHHRAEPAGAGNVKRLFHGFGHVARIFDQKVVLDDGARDADGIAFLKGIEANGGSRHLAADDDHRNAVHIGCGNAGHGIGQAWAGSDQRHAHIASGARVTVSGMDGGLLVAHQHMLNGVLLVESVVNVKDCAARIAPDVLDIFGLERLDENFGAAQLLRMILSV